MVRWLPHDLGTWGFILSVVTLVLAIPLGIAAIVLAPLLTNRTGKGRTSNSGVD